MRIAARSEIEWVNHCYDQVEFVHFNFDNEVIGIAEFGDQKAALMKLANYNFCFLMSFKDNIFYFPLSSGIADDKLLKNSSSFLIESNLLRTIL